jgi:hypothetical protein
MGAHVTIKRMDADGVSRRLPFARHALVAIQGGTVRNWSGGVKTYAMRFEDCCQVLIQGVHFHQDRFRWEWRQWFRAVFNFKGWRWIGRFFGGWTAVATDGTCEITMIDCTRNKWWLRWSGKGIKHINCRTVRS